jgi:hypothetical protein
VLRPDRRTRRALAGALVTIITLALIWPTAIAAGRTSSAASSAGSSAGSAPHSERQPTVKGLGIKPLKGNKGEKRTKPLQTLGANHGDRGTTGESSRSIQAGVTAVPPASVQVTSSGAPAATSFGPWSGINQATSGFEPPDPWVAVGPDDVVQTTNTMLRFTNRAGTPTVSNVQLDDFFAFDELVPGDPNFITGIGDPHWIYDAKHDRWLGTTLAWHCGTAGSVGYVWGAISLTNDPTGGYYQFYIDYHQFLPDFPALGTSGDKFAITANEYVLDETADCTHPPTTECIRSDIPPFLPPGCFDGASIYSFDWTQMLTSPEFPDGTYNFDETWFALRPALAPQSQSNTIFVVGEKLLSGVAGDTMSDVVYMTNTGVNASTSGSVLSAEQNLTTLGVVPRFVDPPAPIQPGGPMATGIVDRRPTDAIWQDNVLTFVSTVPCDPAGGVLETRDCARVAQIKTSTATPTRVQDMLIAATGKDLWYPGVGQSQSGILHVVYSQSSLTEGMSSYDRYQLPGGPVNKLSVAREIADGGAVAYPGDRWGDYVGVAQDPRDTNAVWQGNQYTHSSGSWATRVSELQTAGSTFVSIPPVRVLDSRINLGATGAFVSNVPKTIAIAGELGIPDDAVAITGNLTVTKQTAAGFAALTRVADANPKTSTLNFPLGDVRSNNVTSPLSANGTVGLVYKAIAGKSTHLVLDVTGYFLNDNSGNTFKTLAPVRVLDTRNGTGLNGPFAVNQVRKFPVRGQFTVPADAVAVTGNLTVTGQTAAGYISLSSEPPPPPPAPPATSTINFPLNDVRANGVTINLSSDGSIFAVFKATSGSTHLVFDVTGYYVADLTGARFVPVSPGRRMDTRAPAPYEGLTGAFVANTARTLVIEPYQGIPQNAAAITGNLTVVGQTRAGRATITQIAINNPQTSTLNFPLGDIRANGVTGPLSDPGSVGVVFNATGGTTHLILDVTGYFR